MIKTKNLITIGLLLGGALVLPYFLKGPDGKPLMELGTAVDTTLSTDQTRQTYYKWQDGNGVWQFGDNPPEGVKAVAVNIDTAANILKPTKAPEPPAPVKAVEKFKPEVPTATTNAILNPEAATQTLENAKALQEVLDQRAKMVDEIGR